MFLSQFSLYKLLNFIFFYFLNKKTKSKVFQTQLKLYNFCYKTKFFDKFKQIWEPFDRKTYFTGFVDFKDINANKKRPFGYKTMKFDNNKGISLI